MNYLIDIMDPEGIESISGSFLRSDWPDLDSFMAALRETLEEHETPEDPVEALRDAVIAIEFDRIVKEEPPDGDTYNDLFDAIQTFLDQHDRPISVSALYETAARKQ